MKIRQQLALKYIRTKFRLLSILSPSLAARQAFQLFCTPLERDVKEHPEIFEDCEELIFEFSEYKINGYKWLGNGRGRVLILHGFESTAVNFAGYVEPLLEKGFDVYAFDAPAHGRSSGQRTTAIVYSEFIKHLHQRFGPFDCFLAHSLGGLSLSMALVDIPHSNISRVALIAPATETTTAIRHFANFINLDNKSTTAFKAIIERISGRSISWISVTRAVMSIKASILWIHDKQDGITPLADTRQVQEAGYPNIEFWITDGLGHSRIYRDESVIKRVARFFAMEEN